MNFLRNRANFLQKSLAALGFVALAGFVAPAQAADRAIIVLDASGSMWGQIDGEAKMSIARHTLQQVLGTVPASLELGMIAYGHREKGSCSDIELVVPPGPAATTAPEIVAAANGLTPKGKTPLSAAVKQAAEDLRYTEDKATVILITDGIETCDADPCALGTALEQAGVDLTVHVVGFGLSKSEGQQVACLAENTGGKYFAAANADKLTEALTETVAATVPVPEPAPVPAPEPVVIEKVEQNLKVVARLSATSDVFLKPGSIRFDIHKSGPDGTFEEDILTTSYSNEALKGAATFELPAGRYRVVASRDLARADATVDVTDDRQALADIALDAGIVTSRGMSTATDVIADDDLRWDIIGPDHDTSTTYGRTTTTIISAGIASVTASIGSAKATIPVEVRAGEIRGVDVVLGSGRLNLRGMRSADAKDLDSDIRWDVTSATGDTQTTYGGEVTFDLPAGTYTLLATLGDAKTTIPLTIEAGQILDQTVVVATGRVVAHSLFTEGGPTAKGARFDVLSAEKGADGQRKTIATSYDDGTVFNLGPGRYVLKAQSDLATGEAGIEVKPGASIDVPVILNAGLLAITAPGGERLDLLSEKKDIYGEQAVLATNYGESWQLAVPVGSYVVRVQKKGTLDTVSGTATVKAGERTELTVK